MAEEPPNQTSVLAEHSSSTSSFQKYREDSAMNFHEIPPAYRSAWDDNYNQTYPTSYQPLLSEFYYLQQNQQLNFGPGLYAVSANPRTDHVTGFPPIKLIPVTYSVPTEHSLTENRDGSDGQGDVGQQQPQPPELHDQVVVRRFQIAFQFDLFLILKLAAVIFLFNQDGSKQRLFVLVFFASLIYLCQTGALAPLVRWLSQGMRRGVAPRQRPRPAVRADVAERQGNGNGGAEGGNGRENENEVGGNEDPARVVEGEGNRFWVIVKEIQMIVFGFITSLLPGFHNID